MIYQLKDQFVVKTELAQTWDFFSKAENLPRITPPWMNFTIKTPAPIQIQQDTILDYQIKWMGIPLNWRSQIIDWSPPGQFIDLQLRGPYSLWHHQHTFSQGNEGTICTDRVTYIVPGLLFGSVINALVVQRQLVGIFEYRREVISRELGWVKDLQNGITVKRLK